MAEWRDIISKIRTFYLLFFTLFWMALKQVYQNKTKYL